MNNESFVIERTYNAPVNKVWKAITDRDLMQQWYFNIAAFKPEVGFEFTFDGGS
ncbi:MAG TPA: SRPBCC domain-containing protein, partial [Parafilimonas sp.]|nr:SRPBCC domain-containing protein [Parafilimonas sp.]